MTMEAAPTASSSPAEQASFLTALLGQAFKPSSAEFTCFTNLANETLIPDATTAREIGLAAAFGAVRRYLCDEYGLLGSPGWAPWMIQPEGGDEVLTCCVRYAQDGIHTLLSRARGQALRDGDYAQAKEVARQALVRALVRTGDLVHVGLKTGPGSSTEEELDRVRENWGRRVWTAEDEGSILEVPHLSPSLHPSANSQAAHSLNSDPLASSPFFATGSGRTDPPPHTPADSPVLGPIALAPSPPPGGEIVTTTLYTGYSRLLDGELDEGEKTPTNRSWTALPPLGL